MSATSVTILTHQNELNYSSDPIKADGYYGQTDGVHTVSVSVVNFRGRIHLEGSLATNPTEADWFPIYLTSGNSYREYPINSTSPTGENNLGDTVTEAWTFRANLLWIRARVDRTALVPAPTEYINSEHGSVNKILLNL
jgi:hypothetical protein